MAGRLSPGIREGGSNEEDGIWRLSPAYDITFTVNYKNSFIGDRHAMSIAECDRNIAYGQFLRLDEENDVNNAETIIRDISSILESFEHQAADAGIDKSHTALITGFIKSQLAGL